MNLQNGEKRDAESDLKGTSKNNKTNVKASLIADKKNGNLKECPKFSTTIDDLPNELLIKIFKFLDYETLKNATLISPILNRTISEWKWFKDNTTVVLKFKSVPNFKFKRNYQQMKIYGVDKDPTGNAAKLKKLAPFMISMTSIKRLEMVKGEFYMEDLTGFIGCCISITELKLVHVNSIETPDETVVNQTKEFYLNLQLKHLLGTNLGHLQWVNLHKLRKLTSQNSHWIFCFLLCPWLENLVIDSSPCYETPCFTDLIVAFMCKYSSLKTLALNNSNLASSKVKLNPNFKWKELIIDYIEARKGYVKNWKNLINAADKGATIIFTNFCNASFLVTLFKQISGQKNIENLRITNKFVGCMQGGSVQHLTTLHGIKNVEMIAHDRIMSSGYQQMIGEFAALTLKLPNAEFLETNSIILRYFQLRHHHYDLSKVKCLKLREFDYDILKIRLPSLEFLEIADFSIIRYENIRAFTKDLKLKGIKVQLKDENSKLDEIFGQLFEILPKTQVFEIVDVKGKSHKKVKK